MYNHIRYSAGWPVRTELFLQLAVHGGRVVLAHGLGHGEPLDRNGPCAEGDGNMIADLHVIAGLGRLAVDRHAGIVAGLVRDRAALDEAGNLQIFIKSHAVCLSAGGSGNVFLSSYREPPLCVNVRKRFAV